MSGPSSVGQARAAWAAKLESTPGGGRKEGEARGGGGGGAWQLALSPARKGGGLQKGKNPGGAGVRGPLPQQG